MIRNRRTFVRCTGVTLLTLGAAGCLDDRSPPEGVVEMTDDFAFEPATVPVETGQTVTWTNADAVDHTVTADEDRIPDEATYFASGGFTSESDARTHLTRGLVAPGEEFEHTFERPGTYEYFCIPHERSGMVGTVRVE